MTPRRWSIVVPVKRPEHAKTRLAEALGERRPSVARAFAADTVIAAMAVTDVNDVIVVTDDEQTTAQLRQLGATVIADTPHGGLNAALRHGAAAARARRPSAPVAAISADLPALRPAELERVLAAAAQQRVSFVPDAAGVGTTIYACKPGVPFAPRFGGRSRAAHRAAGAIELDLADIPSVRRDVDTAVDLWDAIRLGLGSWTASIVELLDIRL
jgi:2-phospho-L-lactate guanylyltransferase